MLQTDYFTALEPGNPNFMKFRSVNRRFRGLENVKYLVGQSVKEKALQLIYRLKKWKKKYARQ